MMTIFIIEAFIAYFAAVMLIIFCKEDKSLKVFNTILVILIYDIVMFFVTLFAATQFHQVKYLY